MNPIIPHHVVVSSTESNGERDPHFDVAAQVLGRAINARSILNGCASLEELRGVVGNAHVLHLIGHGGDTGTFVIGGRVVSVQDVAGAISNSNLQNIFVYSCHANKVAQLLMKTIVVHRQGYKRDVVDRRRPKPPKFPECPKFHAAIGIGACEVLTVWPNDTPYQDDKPPTWSVMAFVSALHSMSKWNKLNQPLQALLDRINLYVDCSGTQVQPPQIEENEDELSASGHHHKITTKPQVWNNFHNRGRSFEDSLDGVQLLDDDLTILQMFPQLDFEAPIVKDQLARYRTELALCWNSDGRAKKRIKL